MVATGGVYKGQGRNRRRVMTGAYGEFLVGGAQWSSPGPEHGGVSALSRRPSGRDKVRIDSPSVARVRPRTSKGITDLLSLLLVRLATARPSKKPQGRSGGRPATPSHRPKPSDERLTAAERRCAN